MTTARLGEVASFIRGITFKPDDVVPLGSPGTVGCMRTKNVQANLDLSDVWAVPSELVPRDNQLLRCGDILVSSANSWNLVGKCSWVPKLSYVSSFGGFVAVLRATSDKLDSRYLYRWFSSTRMQTLVRSFGRQTTNISNLDIRRCGDLEIPLPPLPEQRRVAAILDQADALRAKRREALAQLDSLTQSIFIDMFGDSDARAAGWPTSTLKALGKVSTGGTPPSGQEGMFGGSIPFLTPGDLSSDEVPKRKVTDAGAAAAATVRAGATLVCCIGATIGKTDFARVRSAFNQQLNGVEWGPSVHDVYGLYSMRLLKPVIVSRGASTTLPILKKSSFEKLQIVVPPLGLQQTFASRIKAIETLKITHRASLAEADALFASLQHRAFDVELS